MKGVLQITKLIIKKNKEKIIKHKDKEYALENVPIRVFRQLAISWIEENIKILSPEGHLIKFKMNPEQRQLIYHMNRYSLVNKSRQLGISTVMLAYMLFVCYVKDNTSCIMIADKSDGTTNLLERLKLMQENIDDKIKIKDIKNNRNELTLKNGSRISVQTAGTKSIGRGFTCEVIHCSEFAFWSEQEKHLTSLEQALNKSSTSVLCIESTSNGTKNFFYELSMRSLRDKDKSRYKQFFFNWVSDSFKELFDGEIQEARRWYARIHKTKDHYKIVLDLDKTERQIFEDFKRQGMNHNLMLWRRYKLSGMSERAFMQEYPLTIEESFLASDNSFFDIDIMTERLRFVKPELSTSELEYLPAELKLLIQNDELKVWKDRVKGQRYYAGVDTSSGSGQDFSVITILDESGEQVATFRANTYAVYKFAHIIIMLAKYYNNSMLLIERNSYGLSLIEKIVNELYYTNVLRTFKFDKFTGKKTWDYGFYTAKSSKVKLFNQLKEQAETGLILIHDKVTIQEMRDYNTSGDTMQNISGTNDDTVVALALAGECYKTNYYYTTTKNELDDLMGDD